MLAVAGILISTFLTGCSDDLRVNYDGELGKKVQGTVSVTLNSEAANVVSRSVDFSETAEMKVDSYWVGFFDTKTGELIGSSFDEHPRKSDDTRYTIKSNAPFTVDNIDIFYYDYNPEAYIVGVINFNNIKAKGRPGKDAETTDLKTLLKEADNISDILSISVDIASAERANPAESSGLSPIPLMMGFYTPTSTSLHTTVNSDGSVSQNDVKIRLTGNSSFGALQLPAGEIRLQRLMSEINVNVEAGDGVTIKSLEYMVCNNPVETYLVEHTTDNAGSIRASLEDYQAHTANSTELLDNGFTSDNGFRRVSASNGVYSFKYQNYENKHWGRQRTYPSGYNQADHISREQKFDVTTSPQEAVYMALCSDATKPFNNNASFMVLKVDIDAKHEDRIGTYYGNVDQHYNYSGTVYYTIHEGCASNLNGSAGRNGFDFQRIRNTQYIYNITIYGVEDLLVNVEAEDYYHGHNDGITGELWETTVWDIPDDWPSDFPLLNITAYYAGDLDGIQWRLYCQTPDGETNYGDWKREPEYPSYFPSWPAMDESEMGTVELPSPLDREVFAIVNDQIVPLKDLKSTVHPEWSYPLTFSIVHNPISGIDYNRLGAYSRTLYFQMNGAKVDLDGCSNIGSIIGIKRKGYDNRREIYHRMRPSYDNFINIGIDGATSLYNNPFVYNYSPYFKRENFSSDWNYSDHDKNEVYWYGTRQTGVFLKWWDDSGFRDDWIIKIYSPDGQRVEIEKYITTDSKIYDGHDAVYYVPLTGSDLDNLTEGFHSVEFTGIGDPNIYYPDDNPALLENSLHFVDDSNWDFSVPMGPGEQTMSQFFRENLTDGGAYRALEWGGLLIAGGRKVTGANNYMDINRPGFPYDQSRTNAGGFFKFTTYRKGKVIVKAQNTGGETPIRELKLYKPKYSYYTGEENSDFPIYGGGSTEWIELSSQQVYPSSGFVEYTLSTGDIERVTDLFICTTQGLRIQGIQFIPD